MSFHLYDIDEIFSNADGTIQFIELSQPGTGQAGESFWTGQHLTVGANDFIFPIDLPSTATQNTHVLIATSGFAAVAGVTPNYIIPNGFLPTSGTLNYAGFDSVTYTNLPTDGHTSLNIDINSAHAQSTGDNSPTNFAGSSGHVDLAPNTPPEVASPLLDKVAGAGQAFSYRFAAGSFTDADGDTLSYAAKLGNGAALPTWLHFNAATRTFTGTPTATDTGSLNVKVVASDGLGGTVSDLFQLKVISGHVVNGTAAGETLNGTGKADLISGLGGGDTLIAGGGADTISGGAGADIISGGAGADKFVYAENPSGDTIQDFGAGDLVLLENSIFTALGAGALAAGNVQMATQSQLSSTSGDADAFIKFGTNTGYLYYDADGNGAGAMKLIARIHVDATTFDPTTDIVVT